MNKFRPILQTIINILILPVAMAMGLGLAYLILESGSSTPHEASIGDVGGALLFVLAAIVAFVGWVCWMIVSIIKHGEHRGFLFANILVLLSPLLTFIAVRSHTAHEEDQAIRSIKDALVPVECKKRQLFYAAEHVVGIYSAGDTVYLVTGMAEAGDEDTIADFMYNDTSWKGNVMIKKDGAGQENKNYLYGAILGSLRYYALYNDSLYADIDKRAVVDKEYKVETLHRERSDPKTGKPKYYDELLWQVEIKADKPACKYVAFDYKDEEYPTIYVKDTSCNPPSAAAYPKLYAFSDASVWKQYWQRTTVDDKEELFIQVRPSIEVSRNERLQDAVLIAHISKKKACVYNLHIPTNELHPSEAHTQFHSLFRQGDKLYILYEQGVVYFKVPE